MDKIVLLKTWYHHSNLINISYDYCHLSTENIGKSKYRRSQNCIERFSPLSHSAILMNKKKTNILNKIETDLIKTRRIMIHWSTQMSVTSDLYRYHLSNCSVLCDQLFHPSPKYIQNVACPRTQSALSVCVCIQTVLCLLKYIQYTKQKNKSADALCLYACIHTYSYTIHSFFLHQPAFDASLE